MMEAGAAMVDGTNVIWVEESLPPGMSMQKVELVALKDLGTWNQQENQQPHG